MLATTHLHPALSLSVAAIIAGWIVWYWWRLGRDDVPPSRRKIRRISIFLMAMSLPMFVRALSFIDPNVEPRPYVMTWLMALLMIALVISAALVDAINNMRLHRRLRGDALDESVRALAAEIVRKRREGNRGEPQS